METVKEKYQKLAKQYKLPSFDSLNNEFEISTIEETEFLLREIRRKIDEKLELYAKVLEPVLQPEANVCDMHECKALNDEEKKIAYDIYKKIMHINRFSIETSIKEDNKKTSIFINKIWHDWDKIQKDFLNIIVKLKESWLSEGDSEEVLRYMG